MNGRTAKARSRARRAHLERLLAEAAANPPRLVKVIATQEIWMRGKVAFVIPTLDDNFPPRLKTLIDRRRRATLEGRCDCGGERQIVRERITVVHHDACDATDDGIIAVSREVGVPFQRWIA